VSRPPLQALVTRYSQFINFPISIWASKEVDKEVAVEEEEEDAVADTKDEEEKDKDDKDDKDEEEEEEEEDSESRYR
jgi:heat shock protein beta